MSDQRSKRERDYGKLPPGQRVIGRILRWGIDHPAIVRKIPRIDSGEWRLIVDGEVEKPLHLGWEDLMSFPSVVSVSDFHCVEGWSVLDCRWEGVSFKGLVEEVRPREGAEYVFFECADGYATSLPLKDLLGGDVVLAYRLNGEDLEASLGGPLRLVVPKKYAYKSAMWVTRIRFMKTRELGFCEKRGYSDTADAWKNDRYATR